MPQSCKLGLVLPEGLHGRMVARAGAGGAAPPRGALRGLYAGAFADLLDALDDGEAIVFPAVRGAKERVSLRLPAGLCDRIRTRLEPLNLKLTDLAAAAIARCLASPSDPSPPGA